ncbi:MAG: hypothetical protein H6729_08180 [Deltaproteobacteria bacterium]|nr:hypothetical protein [Deltaproteobacteria bacterium]
MPSILTPEIPKPSPIAQVLSMVGLSTLFLHPFAFAASPDASVGGERGAHAGGRAGAGHNAAGSSPTRTGDGDGDGAGDAPDVGPASARWKRLYAPTANASSYLASNWNRFTENYHPNYVFDDNPTTGWVEGAKGLGIGEWIEWPISTLASARAIKIRIQAGYHKNKKLFRANASPKEIEVEARNGSGAVLASTKATLDRAMSWQELTIDTTGKQNVRSLRLVVLSAYPGTTYQDTVISELQTWVDSDVEYKPSVEDAKRDELKAWTRDRLEQAKYFAKNPREYPFVSTHFAMENKAEIVEGQYDEHYNEIKSFVPLSRQLAARKLSRDASQVANAEFLKHVDVLKSLTKVSPNDPFDEVGVLPLFSRKVRLPDGVGPPFALLPWLVNFIDADNVSYFEAAKNASIDIHRALANNSKNTGGSSSEFSTWNVQPASVVWADKDRKKPAKLLLKERLVVEEREVYKTTVDHLLLFDGPHLRDIVSRARTTSSVGIKGLIYNWTHFRVNKQGKVDAIDIREMSSQDDAAPSNAFILWSAQPVLSTKKAR